ncbi:hypothetical protein ACJBU6_05457 [Exserohilum turcicum]
MSVTPVNEERYRTNWLKGDFVTGSKSKGRKQNESWRIYEELEARTHHQSRKASTPVRLFPGYLGVVSQ